MSCYPFTLIIIGEVNGHRLMIRLIQMSRYIHEIHAVTNFGNELKVHLDARIQGQSGMFECFLWGRWIKIDDFKMFNSGCGEIYRIFSDITGKILDLPSICA
jgi:hypothetical protein